MRVTLKLFASLSDYLPETARRTNALQLDVAEGSSISNVIDAWSLPPRLVHLVLLNGEYIPPECRSVHVLNENDVLALWPPIAGG